MAGRMWFDSEVVMPYFHRKYGCVRLSTGTANFGCLHAWACLPGLCAPCEYRLWLPAQLCTCLCGLQITPLGTLHHCLPWPARGQVWYRQQAAFTEGRLQTHWTKLSTQDHSDHHTEARKAQSAASRDQQVDSREVQTARHNGARVEDLMVAEPPALARQPQLVCSPPTHRLP